VQPDAPTEVIKASYRTLMQRLKIHPDLGGDHAEAVLVNEAVATLTDPVRRAAYDRSLKRTPEQQRAQQRQASAPGDAPRAAAPPPRQPPRSDDHGAACGFCGAPCSIDAAKWSDGVCAACGSTLFRGQKDQPNDASRRAIERVPKNMPMTFRMSTSSHKAWTGTTEDVSLNGMRFLSPVEIPVGERLKIECGFCSAVGVAKSVRVEGGGRWHCGVEFVRLRIKHERGGLFSTVA
jgi:DnaJ-class molecular chaperone